MILLYSKLYIYLCKIIVLQIEEDLKMFPKIDLEDFRSNVFKKHKRSSLVHYTIMKNKVSTDLTNL